MGAPLILGRDSFGIWSVVARRAFKAVYVRPRDDYARERISSMLVEEGVAVYVHIPYCTGTCLFCPYVRFPVSRDRLGDILSKYFKALIKEVREYCRLLRDHGLRVTDVHVGGGTPSLVPGKYWRLLLEELSSCFNIKSGLGIEANPEDIRDESRAFDLVDSGVKDFSLGLQSFNPRVLKVLGRRHGVEDSIKAIDNLRRAGARYVNIDLMYMAPGEGLKEWVSDLERALSLDVDEVTCYPTLVVDWCPGRKLMMEGKIPEQPGMKVFKEMVYACEDMLPRRGFKGLEIYGYSRNPDWKYVTVNYEMEGPLIGFGAGAMGFTGGFEYQNTCSPSKYWEMLSSGKLPIAFARDVEIVERAVRYTTCRLFICRGLGKDEFKAKFGREFNELIGGSGFNWVVKALKLAGSVTENERELRLTRKGLFTAHKICWSFVLNVLCRMVEECLKNPCSEKVVIP